MASASALTLTASSSVMSPFCNMRSRIGSEGSAQNPLLAGPMAQIAMMAASHRIGLRAEGGLRRRALGFFPFNFFIRGIVKEAGNGFVARLLRFGYEQFPDRFSGLIGLLSCNNFDGLTAKIGWICSICLWQAT